MDSTQQSPVLTVGSKVLTVPGGNSQTLAPSSPGNAKECRQIPIVTGKKRARPDRAGEPVIGMGDKLTDSRARQARCASTGQHFRHSNCCEPIGVFFSRVRTPCGHGAQVIVEGRESQSDGGENNKDHKQKTNTTQKPKKKKGPQAASPPSCSLSSVLGETGETRKSV